METHETVLRAARRRIAVRQIVQSLQGWHGEPPLGRVVASLEGERRSLRRQPWRPVVRPDAPPLSVLEKIRRFEARSRGH